MVRTETQRAAFAKYRKSEKGKQAAHRKRELKLTDPAKREAEAKRKALQRTRKRQQLAQELPQQQPALAKAQAAPGQDLTLLLERESPSENWEHSTAGIIAQQDLAQGTVFPIATVVVPQFLSEPAPSAATKAALQRAGDAIAAAAVEAAAAAGAQPHVLRAVAAASAAAAAAAAANAMAPPAAAQASVLDAAYYSKDARSGKWYRAVDPAVMLSCDPRHPSLAALHPAWLLGAHIRQAAHESEANCDILPSPYATPPALRNAAAARDSASAPAAMAGAFVVLTKDAARGTPLLCYPANAYSMVHPKRALCLAPARALQLQDAQRSAESGVALPALRRLRAAHTEPRPSAAQPPRALQLAAQQEARGGGGGGSNGGGSGGGSGTDDISL